MILKKGESPVMKKMKIWAHRGASGYLPENTILAFAEAVRMEADGVELDIQLSRDGQIVVIHDETIDRTSDGTGYVKDLTLAELRQYDYSRTFPEYGPCEIPTMKEVLRLLKPTDLTINIELKTGIFDYAGIEEKIIDLVHAEGFADRVIYSSFNHASILKIQQLDPHAKTAFLYADGTLKMPSYGAAYHVDALHPAVYNIRFEGFMQECHDLGLDVNVWTVNDESLFALCGQYGVDTVITNYPDQARQYYEGVEFRDYVSHTLQPWLSEHVQTETIESFDGLKLAAYHAVHDNPRGTVVISHGMGEFFGKYHEMAYRLYQEGYSVFFLEFRGYGRSERAFDLSEDKIHILDFHDYLKDLEAFMEQCVRPAVKQEPLFLLGHSMGGCIGALYLEQHPEDFRCAVLSSPMLELNFGRYPKPAINAMARISEVVDLDQQYAPGQHGFTGVSDFEASSMGSKARYDYIMELRRQDPANQMWGITWGWVKAANAATEEAVKNAGQIRVPVLLCQAGLDTLVKPNGQHAFAAASPFVTVLSFPEAKHEIYNAGQRERERWYKAVLDYFAAFVRE